MHLTLEQSLIRLKYEMTWAENVCNVFLNEGIDTAYIKVTSTSSEESRHSMFLFTILHENLMPQMRTAASL